MFSLAGVPPLFGFWPKFLVFTAAVEANLTWLAAVGIATSVIGAFYYLMIVKTMYMDEPAPAYRSEEHTSELQSLMRSSYAVFCLKKKIQQPIQDSSRHTTLTQLTHTFQSQQ